MSPAVVEWLRAIAGCLALWNLTWSWRGFVDLARGRFWPPAFHQSTVFWISVTAISFQLSHYFGLTQLWRGFSLSLLIAALALAAIGERRGYALRERALYRLYLHLPEATAIADLARVDQAAAAELAAECRRRTVTAMVPGDG